MDAYNDDIFDSLNYVSRGGQKLQKALDYFDVSPRDRVCIDCGASTGGFTDCLLQRGARYVYAIDVGYGQLAWTLRNDPRVCVMERTNIRYVTADMLIKPAGSKHANSTQQGGAAYVPTLAVIDVSFISLSLVLPVISSLTDTKHIQGTAEDSIKTEVICLIKPQFEAGKDKVGKRGVVREKKTHTEVLDAFLSHAAGAGFSVSGITHSPVTGPKGNIEYLGYLTRNGRHAIEDIQAIVDKSHEELSR